MTMVVMMMVMMIMMMIIINIIIIISITLIIIITVIIRQGVADMRGPSHTHVPRTASFHTHTSTARESLAMGSVTLKKMDDLEILDHY